VTVEAHDLGFAERWAALARWQRVVLSVVAGALVLALLTESWSSLVGTQPGGPPASSFSTGDDGVQAWAELLGRSGREVQRDDAAVDRLELDASTDALVLADPGDLDEGELAAVAAFVDAGGRVVAVGASAAPLVADLLDAAVEAPRADPGAAVRPWLPVPELAGVDKIAAGFDHRWSTPAGALGAMGDAEGEPVLLVADVGDGRLVALSDVTPVTNGHLDQADDAALALALVGDARRVVFAESVHGFGQTGLGALPDVARATGLALLVALAVGLWWAAGRFGPPEPLARELRPPRLDLVDAVAADLDRAGAQGADLVVGLRSPDDPTPADLDAALAIGAAAAGRARTRWPTHDLEPPGGLP